jgi:hypothetical protein
MTSKNDGIIVNKSLTHVTTGIYTENAKKDDMKHVQRSATPLHCDREKQRIEPFIPPSASPVRALLDEASPEPATLSFVSRMNNEKGTDSIKRPHSHWT